jgi:hypothetical protein
VKRKQKGSRIRGQTELFDVRSVKAQVVNRMPRGYFLKLMRKGWDPAYFVDVAPDDFVTLGERLIGGFGQACVVSIDPSSPSVPGDVSVIRDAYLARRRCVVLSKGREDTNRRIVAQDDDGWIIGLWIALLRRQLKTGTLDVKAWSFETLTDLEREGSYYKNQAESWIKDLLQKEVP